MIINDLADGILTRTNAARDAFSEAFAEPVIRLGVTGPSRAGKTVFITSLVANLLNRGRMKGLRAEAEGRIRAGFLQPQPDDLIARFDYEAHLDTLTGPNPVWTSGTDRISELRLSLRVAQSGLLGGFRGDRKVHIDIIDYPGEWLFDLALLDQTYSQWASKTLAAIAGREDAIEYLALLQDRKATERFDETHAKDLSASYKAHLHRARANGYYDATPGRFLLPGDLEGSPVLTFAPIAGAEGAKRSTLGGEMARRFEAYKSKVVRPFFRDHFSRIDRQVILVDPLTALARGPRALADLETAMADTLTAFRPGRNGFLNTIFRGRRIEKILFAATKADALHHSQHDALTALTRAMLQSASDRAEFAGATVEAMALSSLRSTQEDTRDGLEMVLGRVEGKDRPVATYPGTLPDAPGNLLAHARSGADDWDGPGYQAPSFLPRPLALAPGQGLPHLRLDRAAEFLIGDVL